MPRQPHHELLDDLLSLLQAGLQTAYELNVLWPGRPLPRLLSGIFQSVWSRHAVSLLAVITQQRTGGRGGDVAVSLTWQANLSIHEGGN